MKSDTKIITALNQCLGNELIAINQYFLHSRMFNNWGLSRLGKHEYKKSIQNMKHADQLIERVLFLEGLPNVQKLGKLLIGEHPEEMLACDLSLQTSVIADLKAAIATCEQHSDYVSRELLEEFLEHEEEQLDWLETQQSLIDKVSIENYLQSMMHTED